MNKIFKYIGSSLITGLALTACSPESFDGPDQAGIPSISNVEINMNVDQTVNQATFSVANMPAQTYAIWTVNVGQQQGWYLRCRTPTGQPQRFQPG